MMFLEHISKSLIKVLRMRLLQRELLKYYYGNLLSKTILYKRYTYIFENHWSLQNFIQPITFVLKASLNVMKNYFTRKNIVMNYYLETIIRQ